MRLGYSAPKARRLELLRKATLAPVVFIAVPTVTTVIDTQI